MPKDRANHAVGSPPAAGVSSCGAEETGLAGLRYPGDYVEAGVQSALRRDRVAHAMRSRRSFGEAGRIAPTWLPRTRGPSVPCRRPPVSWPLFSAPDVLRPASPRDEPPLA